MSRQFYQVTHVIFDVDGLLIDSEQYYNLAIGQVCSKFGKEFSYQLKVEMMGAKPLEGAKICIDRLGLNDKIKPEEFVEEYEKALGQYYTKIKLMPGVERLIRYLSHNNVPMAIATGATRTSFDRKTEHLGEILRKPFSHHVYAGSDPDVARGKPYPDVFEVAAKRFRKAPKSMKNVLVFEDAMNGVKGALTAGMQVVLIPDVWTDISSIDIKPTLILKSLTQFEPQKFGLPPFGSPC